MKKNVYMAPAVEFVSIEVSKDILKSSWESSGDNNDGDHGMIFPF